MASTKDMVVIPGVAWRGDCCGKASGLGRRGQYDGLIPPPARNAGGGGGGRPKAGRVGGLSAGAMSCEFAEAGPPPPPPPPPPPRPGGGGGGGKNETRGQAPPHPP